MSDPARPLRVVLVAPRFPPDVGGLEAYAGWVADQLAAEPGVEVTVVTTTPGRRGLTQWVGGHRVIRLGTWVTLSNTPLSPLWWFQLRRLFRRLAPDVVNVHAPVPGIGDLATFAAGRTPVLMTYHSGSLVKGTGGLVDALLRTYERRVLPRVFARCAGLVAVSPVASTYATGRARLVPPGVDSSYFSPREPEEDAQPVAQPVARPVAEPVAERPARDEGEGTPRLLFVGRLQNTSRWKGVHVLVDALALVARSVPEVVLDVAGDGDAVPWLRQRAVAAGVADRIVWHGSLGRDELVGLYRSASVTVLPSLTESESFGMTLVEAMSCGCAVVGSRVGGIPFVVREGVDGLLAEPGDAASLAAGLVELLTDPVRARAMGREGRRAAVERWDWTHQRAQTLAAVREAAGPAWA